MTSIYFHQVNSLEAGAQIAITLIGEDINKKINSLRATLCQIGRRHNKKFSVRKTKDSGIIEVTRVE